MFLWLEPRKKIICWFDAPIGYISIEWAAREGKDWNRTGRSRHEAGSLYGKDNIVFSLIFPAMLKQKEAIFPDNVPANEFELRR
jgi:methionyl-tRNA synthetase